MRRAKAIATWVTGVVSVSALVALCAPAEWWLVVLVCAAVVALWVMSNRRQWDSLWRYGDRPRLWVLLAVLLLLLVAMFQIRWKDSALAEQLGAQWHMSGRSVAILVSWALALFSLPALVKVSKRYLVPLGVSEGYGEGYSRWASVWGTLLLAGVVVTVFSRSSPLYPLNIWCDPHCFFTVGKGILDDAVPYRDLYEQKGPLLYFLHAGAALVSYDTFTGVWLLEWLAAWGFLYFSHKTMRLLGGSGAGKLTVLAVVVYCSPCFSYGDSAEELCLPLLAGTLWVAVRAVVEERRMPFWQWFVVALGAAAVLWIKYTMLGFYVGWGVFMAWLMWRRHGMTGVMSRFLLFVFGVMVVTIPIFNYFMGHDADSFLREAYFGNNLEHYHATGRPLWSVWLYGIANAAMQSPLLFMAVLVALVARYPRRDVALLVRFSLVASLLVLYCRPEAYVYYALALAVFVPLGLNALWRAVSGVVERSPVAWRAVVAVCCAVVVALSPNVWHIGDSRDDLPQYRFAHKIESCGGDSLLLNYGTLDGGFYTVLGQVPQCRFFGTFNIDLPEMGRSQREFLDEGNAAWVVTEEEPLEHARYELADSAMSEDGHMWRLYKIRN
ncbi:MAG: hypothetical protein J6X70_09795 [Muribaculaceae bacterium]|nr:hypothetical protein [Muribaculaceae bacterium]